MSNAYLMNRKRVYAAVVLLPCFLLLATVLFFVFSHAVSANRKSNRALNQSTTVATNQAQANVAQTGSAARDTQDGIWQIVAGLETTAQNRQRVARQPETWRLNRVALLAALNRAPQETETQIKDSSALLTIPLPNGNLARFRIVDSPLLASALAAQFPEIKSYRGQGIDDSTMVARLDWSPQGFHAHILTPSQSYHVSPAGRSNTLNYLSVNEQDAQQGEQVFQCGVRESGLSPSDATRANAARLLTPTIANGATLRTYRLVVATTWEFSNAHGGGTNAGTLAALNTWLNAVNVIYERELSIRMTLVNNTNILYTTQNGYTASTDPFNDSNKTVMLDQVQTVLRDQVGQTNYDVGHVLGMGVSGSLAIGAEGIASTGVTCDNTGSGGPFKGRGVTQVYSNTPAGSAVATRVWAHELGHQFGASHTFNAQNATGNCSVGQRSPSSAVEPGSGFTLMSYAGICAPDNLASAPDLRFHTQSYTQILNYISGGTGSTCGTTSSTGNNVPTVNAGTDYVIPKNTPFTLTATGGDADAADVPNLTYVWEQIDAGGSSYYNPPYNDAGDPGTTTRPLFRPFSPVVSPARTFPSLSYILNSANDPPDYLNSLQTAEELPHVGRSLNFRASIRDQRGGVNDDALLLTVDGSSGPFQLTAPNGNAAVWTEGTNQTVTWNVANTNLAPVNCTSVKISLSTDGGQTFPTVLATSTPNDGSHAITVPVGFSSPFARVKIEAVGNIFFDISDANFAIGCLQPISPTSQSFAAAGGIGTITLTGNSNCAWQAVSNADWIGITSAPTGNGNGTVDYVVGENTGTARTGQILVGGQIFTVTQAGPCGTMTINPATLPGGTVGLYFYQALSITGGTAPVVFSTLSALPAGLSISTAGVIAGIPTQGGSFPVTVRATDYNGCFTDRNYTLSINSISISPSSLSLGLVNTSYSVSLSASGGTAPYTFSLQSGVLPTGITLSSGGLLAGTPTQSGLFNIVVRATDATSNFSQRSYSLAIRCTSPGITFSPTLLSDAPAGQSYSRTITASGGTAPYTFSLGAGTLPNGLTLSASGVLSGAPTQSGVFSFGVNVTDSNNCASSINYLLYVICPLVTLGPLPDAQIGANYSQQLLAVGLVSPLSYSIITGSLPNGLTLSQTGLIYGVPLSTATGTHYFTVQVIDRYGCIVTQNLAINVVCGVLLIDPFPSPLAVGLAINVTLSASNSPPPFTFAITSGALPNGLMLSPAGALTGMPTQAGAFNFTIRATAANGCYTDQGYAETVLCFYPNPPYSNQNFTIAGGTGTINIIAANPSCAWNTTVSYSDESIPPWITIGPPTSGTGSITLNYTVAPNNGDYREATIYLGPNNEYNIFVTQVASQCVGLSIAPSVLPNGVAFSPYSQVMSVVGGSLPQSSYTWSVIGTLPNGLTFNSATRTISGTPTHVGLFPVTLRATHPSGCYLTLNGNIYILCGIIGPESATLPSGLRLAAYNHTLTFTNARLPVTLSSISGVPAGLTLSSAGILSGTPTVAGDFTINYQVTDANTCIRSHTRELKICDVINVSPSTLPNGTVNVAYSQVLTASGGVSPYSFVVASGTLPTGITLSSSGLLLGTPTQAGNASFTVLVTDSNDCSTTLNYALAINCPLPTLSPTSQNFAAAGGNNTVSVTLPATCNWTAVSNAAWITVTSGASGTGNGTVGYSVAANAGPARNGTITIGGQTFTVSQASNCTYSINPTSTNAPAGGTSGTVAVTASDNACTWTAVSNAAWISVTAGASGSGNGSVSYTVTANNGLARTGTITIAGQTFTINQATNCVFSINPTAQNNIAASGANGNISVTATPGGCTWTAVSIAAWITVTGGASGTGNGTVSYSVAANGGAARTGTVTIAGQTFTITQCATLAFSPTSLPNAILNLAYNQTITASGGVAPYSYNVTGGALPAGVMLSTAGVLSGTPTATGTANFTVTATDANGCATTMGYSLQVVASTITVNTTADTVAVDGFCSLHEAIQATNSSAAVNECAAGVAALTVISFNVGTGTPTINLTGSAFPTINKPVVIDGGSGGATRIEINGAALTGSPTGLRLQGGGSVVRSLVINRFTNGTALYLASNNNTIENCYIGISADGLSASANNTGILVTGTNNLIGGATASVRNVIAANFNNINLGTNADANFIRGNYIGTNASGAAALGGNYGVHITFSCDNNVIGGANAGEGNLISGNGVGVQIENSATNNQIKGNLIGTNANNSALIPNTGSGIEMFFGTTGNVVGGLNAGEGNVIAGNARGVHVASTGTLNNRVLGNAIYSNTSLGIDVGSNGLTANDTNDADTGPNNLQNFPVLNAVTAAGTVTGSLDSLISNSAYPVRLEFFANAACDSSGNGEGEIYLGFVSLAAPGNFTFNYTPVSGKTFITATATDNNGNTSEFSACRQECPTIAWNLSSLPNGTVNAAYTNQSVTASGGGLTFTYSIIAGGLPTGMTLSTAGLLSGTPTQTGPFSFTVRALAGNGCFSDRAYSLLVLCSSLSFSPTNQNFTTNGGNGAFAVTSGGSCNWTATSNSAWLTVTSGASGTSNGTVSYTVAANPAQAARNGLITINGQNFVVYQAGLGNTATLLAAANLSAAECAPDSVVMVLANGLANVTQSASAIPLPTTLAGATVSVRDSANVARNAGIFFVTSTQLNFLVPTGTANGLATVTINATGGAIFVGTIQIAIVAPAVFSAESNGLGVMRGYALRNGSAIEPVARFDQATLRWVAVPLAAPTNQLVLVVLGTGFRGYTVLPTATIGGTPVTVMSAAASPTTIGFDELCLQLPAGLASGTHNINVTVDGKPANVVTVTIQ